MTYVDSVGMTRSFPAYHVPVFHFEYPSNALTSPDVATSTVMIVGDCRVVTHAPATSEDVTLNYSNNHPLHICDIADSSKCQ